MPENDEAQFRPAFEKIRLVLAEAGCGLDAVVEMTSYHVGLREHLEQCAHQAEEAEAYKQG
ncbi:hypothetical protein KO498_05480 [Lentibacter algarum]|uniref:hypothetical protein n=1 Tax=Lentibacter algarum TaxID=576131 RepID=UPI001C06E75B|nr:hypothetical protein [Lentibacter algarum]MBU2981259.1 hypothetical protein [Lentibacter algarum]